MQYQNFELTPRGVLSGLKVKPAAVPDLTVLVEPGVFNIKGGVDLLEITQTQTVNLAASVPGVGSAKVVIYANLKADGTPELSLTPEADKAPGYVRWGQVDNADDHNKGRSIAVAEITLTAGQTQIDEQHISMAIRHKFDHFRTELRGLHNERTNMDNSFGF